MPFSAESSPAARRNIFQIDTAPMPAAVPAAEPVASMFDHPACSEQPQPSPPTRAKAPSWWRASLKRSLVVGTLGMSAAVAGVFAVGGTGHEPGAERLTDPPTRPSLSRQRATGKRPNPPRPATGRTKRPDAQRPPVPPWGARRQGTTRSGRRKPAGAAASASPNPAVPAPAPAPPAVPVVPRAPQPTGPLPVEPGAPPQFM